MSYAELHCRTHYSFLTGSSHPRDLIARASELELHSLAITDLNGVYGIPKAYLAAKEHPKMKLIVGSELTMDGLPRLNLLATDRDGYGLMCRLLSMSHEGREKGDARLEWARFTSLIQTRGSSGLIVIPEELPFPQTATETGLDFYAALKDLFADRLCFYLSRVLDGRDSLRTESAHLFGKTFGAKILATADVHYHHPARRPLQDVMTAIRHNVPLDELGHHTFSNAERYLKSPAEMKELFADCPEAIANTVEVAERCHFSPSELRYHYPSEWIPVGETAQSYLEKCVWKGAHGRYPAGIPVGVETQLRHELQLTQELRFADYFLTIYEIVEFAKSRKILCQGRGSAANSVICYCLGVTAVDPVRVDLLFERFLSAERNEPPDIDVDFEHERREEVIQHIYDKYGRERAGMVATFITYRSRSARRDVAKALGASWNPDSAEGLLDEIHGFPRHLGIHSGGFTLSAVPIIETVPIEPARMEGRTVVQWDKDDLASLGLLKVDILSLGMLTAIRKCIDLVQPKRPGLELATIPEEEPETYRMIQRGDVLGVFQIESRAQIGMLKRLLPNKYYDLVIQVAIVRPGPIVGKMVHPYLRRRRGLELAKSPHPKLEAILKKTLGVPLFQEQVMRMAIEMAGFTPGESDELRRSINAWKSTGSLEKMGRKLQDGLLANGLSREFVDRIFLQIQGFAEYGFPESHAASFALLAYSSSYLKCHFPAEFACALINSQPMGFYSSHTLIEDVKRHGVRVLPVHPGLSQWDCTIEEVEGQTAIRVGFCVVNGLSEKEWERVSTERARKPFESLIDFISRTTLKPKALYHLCLGEAFACFGLDQRQSLWQILGFRTLIRPSQGDQLGLFEGVNLQNSVSIGQPAAEPPVAFHPLSDYETICWDYQAFGLSVRGHPMGALRAQKTSQIPPTTTASVKRAPSGTGARLAGLIIARQQPRTAKGTVFATIEDEEGFLDLILRKEVFEKFHDIFVNEPFLIVSGRVQRDAEAVSVLVRKIEVLDVAELRASSRDFH